MSKKFWILILAIAGMTFQSCSYDDQPLWDAVEDLDTRLDQLEKVVNEMNGDLSELQTIISKLQNNVAVKDVNVRGDGYEIRFSDGTVVVIRSGKDGKPGQDGKDAPVVSIRKDLDGVYYWTIDGEWLHDLLGRKIPVEGQDGQNGQDGKDAPVPQLRVNPETAEWEISVDGGLTWEKTGMFVSSESGNPDGIFAGVDNSNPDYVILTLIDGTEIKLDRYTENTLSFVIEDLQDVEYFKYGVERTFNVTANAVAQCAITKPDGWKVSYEGSTISVTAPTEDNSFSEAQGVIAFNLVAESGRSMIVKMNVAIQLPQIRILTFEDEDFATDSYTLDYCGKTITCWSDLIDNPQYGGPMLYGDYSNAKYSWNDKGNTMLSHVMPKNFGSYCYWGGGHAVSNYQEMNLKNGNSNHQLSVYYQDPVTGKGGHNGSDNFCVHFGYRDDSPYNMTEFLPALEFSDGRARVIDHMYVMNTTYNMNCYIDGNGLTDKINPGDWVKLVAIGFDASGSKTGECEIYMVNGPDNIISEWTKWDLSSLGKIVRIEFNVTGSSDNGYGFSQPAYFAYDDVAVVMD